MTWWRGGSVIGQEQRALLSRLASPARYGFRWSTIGMCDVSLSAKAVEAMPLLERGLKKYESIVGRMKLAACNTDILEQVLDGQ
ncbi:MAG: hypothetical protein KF752_19890 [Pirellulaceae bacterium]|nr:hypothetical protein [Pirellulaceae bacterium]